jgi:transcriptional regulator with XRE-family HTH domain
MNNASDTKQRIQDKFSKRLKDALYQKDIKYSDLEKKLGIGRSNITMYVNGSNLPSVETLFLLAEAVDEPIDYLLGLSDKNPNMTLREEGATYGLNNRYLEEVKQLSGELAVTKMRLKECEEKVKYSQK